MTVSISKYGCSLFVCLLCICAQAQPNWKTLMDAESPYTYYLGNQEPPAEWNTLGFVATTNKNIK